MWHLVSMILSINNIKSTSFHYAVCHVLYIVMLIAIMLIVITLIVIILIVMAPAVLITFKWVRNKWPGNVLFNYLSTYLFTWTKFGQKVINFRCEILSFRTQFNTDYSPLSFPHLQQTFLICYGAEWPILLLLDKIRCH